MPLPLPSAESVIIPPVSPRLQERPVAAANWFRYLYLAHASRPKSVRQLYRLAKRQKVCRIVEVGVSDVRRSVSLIEVAQRYAADKKVSFTGIDWFEVRAQELPALSLKEAYRVLRATEANVRLVPGTPGRSLAAAANAHQNTDLILISAIVPDDELKAAWFYVPRMLHAGSVVLRERREASGEPSFDRISSQQIATWAAGAAGRRAA
jgi:hypothetical protein